MTVAEKDYSFESKTERKMYRDMISISEKDSGQLYYLRGITAFLMEEYEHIFGADIINNKLDILLFNDPKATCPMFIINSEPLSIRLAQQSLSYWAQTIYQLSHELCHFALYQRKIDKAYTVKWFEEIVCEAVSLHALKYSS